MKSIPKTIVVGLDIFDGLWVSWCPLLQQMSLQPDSQKITPRVNVLCTHKLPISFYHVFTTQ